jgi:hypothetical protein
MIVVGVQVGRYITHVATGRPTIGRAFIKTWLEVADGRCLVAQENLWAEGWVDRVPRFDQPDVG